MSTSPDVKFELWLTKKLSNLSGRLIVICRKVLLATVHICLFLFLNWNDFQEGEDENDTDGIDPAENNTLNNDEESEHTMLLGRGVIQQPYKGNKSLLKSFALHPEFQIFSCFNCWLWLLVFNGVDRIW